MTLSLDRLLLELFRSANRAKSTGDVSGEVWERTARRTLERIGIRVSSDAFGIVGCSGISHQIDGSFACDDGIVLAEWKARRGVIAKSELLAFDSVSKDIACALNAAGSTHPVYRVFGGPCHVSRSVRVLAAQAGIALVELERWPALTVASQWFPWGDLCGPLPDETALVSSLVSPVNLDNRSRTGRHAHAALEVLDRWSETAWEAFDSGEGRFEAWLESVA